ncbi:neutral ceramidase-like [Aristolochia californica]|uniref:neutral ceramidase-like n=1 Tax=Aristolochia californica TaxID=171875 RepID=UPI0035DE1849
MKKSTLLNFASKFNATGGQPCNQTTSKNFKVRKTDGSQFVAAFCQSNMGDVSPNIMGEICLGSGKACDVKHSSCQGNNQLCVSRGPGYPNEVLSTGIIGFRQFNKAIDLFDSAKEKLHGQINYRHVHLNLTSVEIALPGNKVVKTCPAAVGPGFAAGTTDGPGAHGFQQGDTGIKDFWTKMRDMLKEPGEQQVNCHLPKTILLDVGEMFDPYPWAPAILPIQILRIGKLIILSVPGEFTTMAGRRLREAVKESLIQYGNGEFDDDIHVVIAGPTNAYSQYVTTIEEYQQQRHEAASTLYGPHTLSAYIQEFKKLATAMATGEHSQGNNNPSPPDLSPQLISPRQGPLVDEIPPGKKFGDIKEDARLPPDKNFLYKGDKVRATFWSGNPTNDLLTEGTFAVVERWLPPNWYPVYDDDDLCLCFEWRVDENGHGLATVVWEIQEADAGIYRLRHFGAAKELGMPLVKYFTGTSRAFPVL